MKKTSYDLQQKAKELKRKEKFKKKKLIISNSKKSNLYYIYARARKPIPYQAENIYEALKWAVKNIPIQDVLEIHDENTNLLWGRYTGLIKESFNEKHSI